MKPKNTRTYTMPEGRMATAIRRVVLQNSAWMQVTPLPDGFYEICVKNEPRHLLRQLSQLAAAPEPGTALQRQVEVVKIAHHLNGRPKTDCMDIVPRPDGVTYGPRNPPPGWRQMRQDDLALKWLYASFPEKRAGLENYIRPEDFWRCATGRVHPEEVVQHFIRQTSFA